MYLFRLTTTAVALVALSLSISAQNKLDLGSRARIRSAARSMQIGRGSDGSLRMIQREKKENTIRAFVMLTEGADVSVLESADVTVRSVRGNMALAEFPESALAAIEKLEEVKSIQAEKPISAKLDIARAVTGIDKIHSGIELPQSYTGKNVVAGIFDGGFDPNHVNFQNPDGTSRISVFTYYRPTESGEYAEEVYGADYIPNIDTESDQTFHGTHTLGIMAGGYKGKVMAAVKDNMFTGTVEEIDNPYYGVAYDADIALGCGPESDYFIAMGCEQILNYAYFKQQPAVINLSLGSNLGPHDGSSTLCQYIDLASELDNVIFCVSAGNEGDYPIALHKTFTADDTQVGSFFYPGVQSNVYPNLRYGQTYIYSNDETPFTVQAILYNRSRGKVAFRMPMPPVEGQLQYWVSDTEKVESDTDIYSQQLGNSMVGYVGIGAQHDETTGRYYALLDYSLYDSEKNNGNYIFGFEVTGSDGQRVDIFCDGLYNSFTSYEIEGYSDGMTDGTISDVACGKSTIVVGSYNTRDDWASLDGFVYGYKGAMTPGKISSFSSYGKLYDGRELPTVCAPGATVISSSNEYYLESAEASDAELQAALTTDSRRYSWHQCVGTSMATPLVSGAIALWLEADPTLRAEDVKDIIRKTSIVDDDVTSTGTPVQWGAGKFDAYAGLKEVLRRTSGIADVTTGDQKTPLVTVSSDRNVEIYAPGFEHIDAALYNIGGMRVTSVKADGDTAVLDCSSVQKGVYLLQVNGSHNQKLFIR